MQLPLPSGFSGIFHPFRRDMGSRASHALGCVVGSERAGASLLLASLGACIGAAGPPGGRLAYRVRAPPLPAPRWRGGAQPHKIILQSPLRRESGITPASWASTHGALPPHTAHGRALTAHRHHRCTTTARAHRRAAPSSGPGRTEREGAHSARTAARTEPPRTPHRTPRQARTQTTAHATSCAHSARTLKRPRP